VTFFVGSGQAVDASKIAPSFHFIYAKETRKIQHQVKEVVSKLDWQNIE